MSKTHVFQITLDNGTVLSILPNHETKVLEVSSGIVAGFENEEEVTLFASGFTAAYSELGEDKSAYIEDEGLFVDLSTGTTYFLEQEEVDLDELDIVNGLTHHVDEVSTNN